MLDQSVDLVGREALLDGLERLFEGAGALVTVHGAPGVGKSALARFWLARAETRAETQALRVDLSGLHNPQEAMARLVQAAGAKMPEDERPAAMMERLLLVCDRVPRLWLIEHLDQLAEPLAPWLSQLHRRLDGVSWLITSRQLLHVRQEQVLHVGPLAWGMETPEACASGVLFCRRARLGPGQLGEPERRALGRILDATGGVPLAIELAAAKHRYAGLEGLAQELDQGVMGLRAKWRDGVARHQSLRAALESSWGGLSASEQHALAALSVFEGPFERKAALAVMGDGVDGAALMESLCDQAMLQLRDDGLNVWCSLLAPIRAFAVEHRSPEVTAAAMVQKARFMTHDAQALFDDQRREPRKSAWHHSRRPHLESIWRTYQGAEGAREAKWVLCAALLLCRLYADVGPIGKGIEVLTAAVAQSEPYDAPEIVALRLRAKMAIARMDERRSGFEAHHRAALEEVIDAAAGRDDALECNARYALAFALHHRNNPECESLFEQVLGLASGPTLPVAGHALRWLAERARGDDIGRARRLLQRACVIFEQSSDLYGMALARTELGLLLVFNAEHAQGIELLEAAIDSAKALGIQSMLLYVRRFWARAMIETGALEEAESAFATLLGQELELSRFIDAHSTLLYLIWVQLKQNKVAEARHHLERAMLLGQKQNLNANGKDIERLLEVWIQTLEGNPSPQASELARDVAKRHKINAQTKSVAIFSVWREFCEVCCPQEQAKAQIRFEVQGGWFELQGQPVVFLHHRPALKGVLAALVRHRQESPGQWLGIKTLFEAGWPGQQVLPQSQRSRVYVAMGTLRKMGLKGVLLNTPERGYALDPSVAMEWVAPQGTQTQTK